MKGDRPSHILNIGSMGGVAGGSKYSGLSGYSASKAAVANLTECLAEELKEHIPGYRLLTLYNLAWSFAARSSS